MEWRCSGPCGMVSCNRVLSPKEAYGHTAKWSRGRGQSFRSWSGTAWGMEALQQGQSPLSHHLSSVPGIATVSSSGWSGFVTSRDIPLPLLLRAKGWLNPSSDLWRKPASKLVRLYSSRKGPHSQNISSTCLLLQQIPTHSVNLFVCLFVLKHLFLFIWLHRILVVACGI